MKRDVTPRCGRFEVDALEARIAFSFATPLTPTMDTAYDLASPAVAYGGSVWFTAGRIGYGGLYRSDGTPQGTALTTATLPQLKNASFSQSSLPVVANGKMFLLVGQTAWVTDGTAAGTQQLSTATVPTPTVSNWATVHDDKVYFTGTDAAGLSNLYVSDGTPAGTQSIAKAAASRDTVLVSGFSGNSVYFNIIYDSGDGEFDRTDGHAVISLSHPGGGIHVGGKVLPLNATRLVFVVRAAIGSQVAITDGTAQGTYVVETTATYISGLSVLNGVAYFFGKEANGSAGIYRTDGSRAGTYRIADSSISTAYTYIGANTQTFAGRLYLQTYGGDGGATYAIAADGSIQMVGRSDAALPLTVDGSRLYVRGVTAYISADTPTEITNTDALVYGDATASAGGRFVYLANPSSSGSPSLYAWDSNSAPVGSISGTVYNDVDGDGVHQTSEPGVSGVTVYADLNGNGVDDSSEPSAVTSSYGSYTLSPVPVGTWQVAIVAQPGAVNALLPVTTTVTPGQESDADLLVAAGANLVGTVYTDANANGVRDDGEAGLGGVKVFIDADPAAVTAAAADPFVYTDANGRYVFANVAALHGYLRVQAPAATYRVTQPNFSTDSLAPGTVGVVTGPAIAVAPPGSVQVNFTVDVDGDGVITAADALPSTFRIAAFVDLDHDGVFDNADVSLSVGAGATLPGIPAGTQTVRFVPPQGWSTSLPGNAVDVTVRSGAVAAIPSFVLTQTSAGATLSGHIAADADFSGTVSTGDPAIPLALLWDDTNANGVRDFGEAYTYSDASGAYRFTDLVPAAHRIAFSATGYTPANGATTYFTVDTTAGAATQDLSLYAATRQVRVGGVVRYDANNNGIVDDTDPVLHGAVISGTGFSTLPATDAQGHFSMTAAAGSFAPRVAYLPGYTNVGTAATVALKTGQTYDGYVLLVSGPSPTLAVISGVVFNDANANGVRDNGEAGLAGVTVWADANRNGIRDATEPAAVTAADGSYALGGLPPGTVNVYVSPVLPQFATNVTANHQTLTLNTSDVPGINFGLATGITVTGTVYNDYDRDGTRGTYDDGLGSVIVWADLNANGMIDAGEPQAISNFVGGYTLTGLAANTPVTVRVYDLARQAVGSGAVVVSATAAGGTARADFGLNRGTAVIAGHLYYDGNQNGMFDAIEASAGLTVTLINAGTNAVIATAKTIYGDSSYHFSELQPGTYRLTFTIGNSYELRQGGGSQTLTVAAGQVQANIDFGYFRKPMTYTGRVLNDLTNNGPDDGDTPIAGIRAFIDVNNDGSFDAGDYSALSDATGTFAITGVPFPLANDPLSLYVQNPAGYLRSTFYNRTPTSVDPSDPNVSNVTDAGDFLFYAPTGTYASGYLYEDLNTNGVRDPGEPGLNGIKIGRSFTTYDYDAVLTDQNGYFVYFPRSSASNDVALLTNLPPTWISTDGTSGRETVSFATGNPQVNLGFVPFQIGGTTYDDTNGNNVMDPGETPAAGRVVWIDANGNGVLDTGEKSATSDANGFYSFTGLGTGTFHLAQQLPDGLVGQSVDVTLVGGTAKGGITLGAHAAAVAPTTIASVTIDDGTAQRSRVRSIALVLNGTVSASGIAAGAFALTQNTGTILPYAVQVASVTAMDGDQTKVVLTFVGTGVVADSLGDGRYTLTIDGSKIVDTTGRTIDAAGTGATGSSSVVQFFRLFGDLDGNGNVEFSDFLRMQSAYGTQTGDAKFIAGLDYTGNGTIDFSDFLQFQSHYGTTINGLPTVNAVVAPTGILRGTAFDDTNDNGIRDTHEATPAGKTVYLDTNNNGKLDPGEKFVTTDSTGAWSFTGLPAGVYHVRRAFSTGYTQSNPLIDTALAAGQTVSGLFIGSHGSASKPVGTASISGFAFDDKNKDGVYDRGDTLAAGKTIWIDLDGDGVQDAGEPSVVTDSKGNYTFKNLAAGTYHVRRAFPKGYAESTPARYITLGTGKAVTGVSVGSKQA